MILARYISSISYSMDKIYVVALLFSATVNSSKP